MLFHTCQEVELGMLDSRYPSSSVAITTHDIINSKSGPVLGAGRTLSQVDKQRLQDLLNNFTRTEDEWIPENVLIYNYDKLVWFVPGSKRKMYFKGKKPIHYELHWPSLVFTASGKNLKIAAYAGKGRPRQDQILYHAPLWNIDESGNLCTGSCEVPADITLDSMEIWENAIFNSYFTHENHSEVIKASGKSKKKPNYVQFIRAKAKSGKPWYAAEMNAIGLTLDQWISVKRY